MLKISKKNQVSITFELAFAKVEVTWALNNRAKLKPR